jgi:hypothetical protein
MRFSLPNSYSEFFLKHHVLEVEDLLSTQDAMSLSEKTEKHLLDNLHQKPLNITSNSELWKAGKNHWLIDPEIKKILFRLQLGEICHFLFKKRPIRLAYTQAVFTESKQDSPFSTPTVLEEISSSSPLLGGVLLCLSSSENQEEVMPLTPDLKTIKAGRAFFFSKEYPLPFPEIFQQKGLRMLLLAFTPGKVRYKLEPKDTHTHELKKLGYGFGDLIKEDLCPYLYR